MENFKKCCDKCGRTHVPYNKDMFDVKVKRIYESKEIKMTLCAKCILEPIATLEEISNG